ncbi:hypothetical protein [Adhaeribacter soli]|uniref:Uncharacterized protein n=1 Tax=Adhaeribacter soli TaxID=2607655 RepID=A0A5N1IPG6_9BACT|nr:hypothetical protein [Adhaeribacter soli]KAA9325641.1 hypothetical protein F0P94_17040 [Adhaeribacter soli]
MVKRSASGQILVSSSTWSVAHSPEHGRKKMQESSRQQGGLCNTYGKRFPRQAQHDLLLFLT